MKAFVFPGQGSQSVGMLAAHASRYDIFQDHYKRASDCLDFDMQKLVSTGSDGLLNQTAYTQPAILSVSCALWQLWLDNGGDRPYMLAGHSLGEYSALVAAGSMTFEDAVSLVHLRGTLMQQAVADGMMLAIVGLDDELVEDICKSVCEQLGEGAAEPANYNAPGQVVVAGKASSLDVITHKAKAAGAKRIVPISVSVPSHSSLMKKASEQLASAIEGIILQNASIPVVQNADAKPKTDAAELALGLAQQLYKPVLWTRSVQYLCSQGITDIYECGPGKVLQGLIRRISRDTQCLSLSDIDIFMEALERQVTMT